MKEKVLFFTIILILLSKTVFCSYNLNWNPNVIVKEHIFEEFVLKFSELTPSNQTSSSIFHSPKFKLKNEIGNWSVMYNLDTETILLWTETKVSVQVIWKFAYKDINGKLENSDTLFYNFSAFDRNFYGLQFFIKKNYLQKWGYEKRLNVYVMGILEYHAGSGTRLAAYSFYPPIIQEHIFFDLVIQEDELKEVIKSKNRWKTFSSPTFPFKHLSNSTWKITFLPYIVKKIFLMDIETTAIRLNIAAKKPVRVKGKIWVENGNSEFINHMCVPYYSTSPHIELDNFVTHLFLLNVKEAIYFMNGQFILRFKGILEYEGPPNVNAHNAVAALSPNRCVIKEYIKHDFEMEIIQKRTEEVKNFGFAEIFSPTFRLTGSIVGTWKIGFIPEEKFWSNIFLPESRIFFYLNANKPVFATWVINVKNGEKLMEGEYDFPIFSTKGIGINDIFVSHKVAILGAFFDGTKMSISIEGYFEYEGGYCADKSHKVTLF